MVVVLKISTLPRMILINAQNGIFIQEAGDGINIKGNGMEYNSANGISITNIGDNVIQSNEISYSIVGVKFNDDYLKPKNQDVSSNVIHHTSHVAVEAKDTYYYDYCEPLQIGDNWYADDVLMCPKVRSNNMKFSVTQIGPNQFQATFYDSKGNIASLLPDRTLTYQTNDGEIISMTISGGTGVFTVDAVNGDKIKATVDSSHRDNTYKAETKQSTNPTNGVTPTYEYPSIDYADSYDNYGGNGNGDGNGDGNGGNTNKGNGSSSHESRDNTGNSTHSQNTDPGSNSNTQINDVSQSYETQSTTSEASASQSSSGDASEGGSQSQSVVKQIIIEEEDIYRVTGISIIVALIILTIGLYYRDDIKEMNSKR